MTSNYVHPMVERLNENTTQAREQRDRILTWFITQFGYLSLKREWDMDDNFECTEGLINVGLAVLDRPTPEEAVYLARINGISVYEFDSSHYTKAESAVIMGQLETSEGLVL